MQNLHINAVWSSHDCAVAKSCADPDPTDLQKRLCKLYGLADLLLQMQYVPRALNKREYLVTIRDNFC